MDASSLRANRQFGKIRTIRKVLFSVLAARTMRDACGSHSDMPGLTISARTDSGGTPSEFALSPELGRYSSPLTLRTSTSSRMAAESAQIAASLIIHTASYNSRIPLGFSSLTSNRNTSSRAVRHNKYKKHQSIKNPALADERLQRFGQNDVAQRGLRPSGLPRDAQTAAAATRVTSPAPTCSVPGWSGRPSSPLPPRPQRHP